MSRSLWLLLRIGDSIALTNNISACVLTKPLDLRIAKETCLSLGSSNDTTKTNSIVSTLPNIRSSNRGTDLRQRRPSNSIQVHDLAGIDPLVGYRMHLVVPSLHLTPRQIPSRAHAPPCLVWDSRVVNMMPRICPSNNRCDKILIDQDPPPIGCCPRPITLQEQARCPAQNRGLVLSSALLPIVTP